MAFIFLSHSSADKAFVYRLAEDLKAKGHELWLDEWVIRVGQEVVQRMDEGVRRADYVILALSPEAISSGWVEREWKAAYNTEIQQGRLVVLPVLVRSCSIPPELQTTKYADFSGDYSIGLDQLFRVLRTVHVRNSEALSNRRVLNVRRGPAAEHIKNHRIAGLVFGQQSWSLGAVIESVGPPAEALDATLLAWDCIHALISGSKVLSEETVYDLFVVVNKAVRHINASKELTARDVVGARMAVALQIGAKVFLATCGSACAIGISGLDDGDSIIHVVQNNIFMPFLMEWDQQGLRPDLFGRAGLGFTPDEFVEQITLDNEWSRLDRKGDCVVLTSFLPPMQEDFSRRILSHESGADLARLLCEEHEPESEECVSLAIIRT